MDGDAVTKGIVTQVPYTYAGPTTYAKLLNGRKEKGKKVDKKSAFCQLFSAWLNPETCEKLGLLLYPTCHNYFVSPCSSNFER